MVKKLIIYVSASQNYIGNENDEMNDFVVVSEEEAILELRIEEIRAPRKWPYLCQFLSYDRVQYTKLKEI